MERQDHHVAAGQRGSRNETPRLRSIEKQLNPELLPLQGPSKQLNPELIPLRGTQANN